MSTTETGFICDWCKRAFGVFVVMRVVDGLQLCPICYKKNFEVTETKRWKA